MKIVKIPEGVNNPPDDMYVCDAWSHIEAKERVMAVWKIETPEQNFYRCDDCKNLEVELDEGEG